MSIFLIICAIAAIFLKKKKKKKNGRSEFDEPLMPSIFLLHSNEERHQGNIQMLKKTLRERLSLSEVRISHYSSINCKNMESIPCKSLFFVDWWLHRWASMDECGCRGNQLVPISVKSEGKMYHSHRTNSWRSLRIRSPKAISWK